MLKFLKIFKKEYQTLNSIEISEQNLLDNYKYLSRLDEQAPSKRSKNLQVAPVLKSNAYGHGIQLVAKILDQRSTPGVEQKIPFFCVDSLYEAYELLKIKIKTPILIMGYTVPENFRVKKLPFSFAVFDLETAEILNKYQSGAKVHLFVNTGMNREGISIQELDDFLTTMKQFKNLKIEGLMSHLASFESDKDPLFLNQIKNFQKALQILKKHKIKPRYIHLGASGALTNPKTSSIIAKISNLTRTGISLYGFNLNPNSVILNPKGEGSTTNLEDSSSVIPPQNDKIGLKPVLTLKTHLAQIKTLKKGEKVGYDGTFTAKKDMLIGILPIGYNDGVDRRLSNQGVVTIHGQICKILGRVSMNITTVDLTNVKNVQKGDEVIIFSNDLNDPNSIQNSAQICQTIPYELLIHLDPTIKRVILD